MCFMICKGCLNVDRRYELLGVLRIIVVGRWVVFRERKVNF